MVPAARQAQSTQAHSLSTDTRPRPTPDGYLEAPHPGFDPASGVIAGPSFPDRPPETLRCPQDVVSGLGCGAVLFPAAAIPADRNDRRAATLEDRGVAASGVESPVAGHGADLLVWWELVQKVRQDGAVALVA